MEQVQPLKPESEQQPEWLKPALWFRVLVSVCATMYFLAVIIWLLPSSRFRDLLATNLIRPVFNQTGLWQGFAVYCPNPRQKNVHVSALVTFADGSTALWDFPRLERMPVLERAQKERIRKVSTDYVFWSDYKWLCPDTCKYIARQYAHDGKIPVTVTLLGHWSLIPPPEEGLGKPIPRDSNLTTIYVHHVKNEDITL